MHAGTSLRYVQVVASAALAALGAGLAYGVLAGDFRADGSELLSNPWGVVTLVDVYAGFALFSTWVVWRERKWWRAAAWIGLVLATGNLAAALYVIVALSRSRHDPARYWMGDRAPAAPSHTATDG